jgi:hypothetical protein
MLMKMFPPPGHEPEFFPDTEVDPDWDHYSEAMKTCVFCVRRHDQVPQLIISGAQDHAICSLCIEELNAVLRGPVAYQAWLDEERRKAKRSDQIPTTRRELAARNQHQVRNPGMDDQTYGLDAADAETIADKITDAMVVYLRRLPEFAGASRIDLEIKVGDLQGEITSILKRDIDALFRMTD